MHSKGKVVEIRMLEDGRQQAIVHHDPTLPESTVKEVDCNGGQIDVIIAGTMKPSQASYPTGPPSSRRRRRTTTARCRGSSWAPT